MSIDISVQNAEFGSFEEPCFVCASGSPDAECDVCEGKGTYTERRTLTPSVNMANASWGKIASLIGLPNMPYGDVGLELIPTIRRNIFRVLNSSTARETVTEEPREERGFEGVRVTEREDGIKALDRGCRIIHGGYTDERVVGHLRNLDAVLAAAQEAGEGIGWD